MESDESVVMQWEVSRKLIDHFQNPELARDGTSADVRVQVVKRLNYLCHEENTKLGSIWLLVKATSCREYVYLLS